MCMAVSIATGKYNGMILEVDTGGEYGHISNAKAENWLHFWRYYKDKLSNLNIITRCWNDEMENGGNHTCFDL